MDYNDLTPEQRHGIDSLVIEIKAMIIYLQIEHDITMTYDEVIEMIRNKGKK